MSPMLNWYLNQSREHGAWAATLLLCRILLARGSATLVNKFLPGRVLCPCCGWEGRRFLDYMEFGLVIPRVECPQCNSHDRHRALYLWLKNDFQLEARNGVGLIFAPERAFHQVWQQATNLRTFKVDIEASRDVDMLADLQRLPFATDSIDFIWCHHILQLIEDDRAAMRELHRVLRPRTGRLILSVAIAPHTRTVEYGFENKEVLRFWRIYGDDFISRLAEAGFAVEAVDYNSSLEECLRYGLNPQESFYICQKNPSNTDLQLRD
jgi:SAM-dependent methyltransferase